MWLRKRVAFGVIYGLVLAAVTLAGIEVLASFYAPSWPARALRATGPVNPVSAAVEPFKDQPWLATPFNSWGMRDSERTVAKPANTFRAVFVGDSFVESPLTPLSLPAAVARRLPEGGRNVEAIDLGISATSPRSYYYRTRDVALKLSPDALLLFIYAGNDFVLADQGYSASSLPPLVDESPGSSLVGTLMPRTNWLAVNRLRLAESLMNKDPPPAEETVLYDAVHAPPAERLPRLVAHIKKYYFPQHSDAEIGEVLSRGGGRFWRELGSPEGEREFLLGWTLANLLSWETGTFGVAASVQDARRLTSDGEVQATLSWIAATDRLAREMGVPLRIFLAPVGTLDPDYVEFWKPWPRAYSFNYVGEDREIRLAAALGATGIRFVDLREDLAGIAGTYRKRDGHWTQKGEAIVADRVARELLLLMKQ